MFRKLILAAAAAAVAAGTLFFWPEIIMREEFKYRNVILRSSEKFPPETEEILRSALQKLEKSGIPRGNGECEIFIAGFGKFSFFARPAAGDFLWLNPVNGKIFVAEADFGKNRARRKGLAAERDLDTVIAKGITLKRIRDMVGFLKYVALTDWKKQGLAEREAGRSNLYMPSEVCEDISDLSFKHYKQMLAVDLLMRENSATFEDVLNSKRSFESLEKDLRKRYCD